MKLAVFAAFLIVLAAVSAVPDCPVPDGDFVALFPHDTDCTKFYKCDRGVASKLRKPQKNLKIAL